MSLTVISVEHLTKQYDLGVIGTGTLTRDLNRWWAHARKQPDPYTRIGQKDAFESIGEIILALDDVSFQVQQSEALGIIGRNGAGKSTLLKILSRVTAPTSGVVKVKGRIGSLLEVGTGFHPELTGRENVYLNGAIMGMRKAEVSRRFDEIVDFSGVAKFIDTPVKRYSSGMYVRLAFAVAAHLDPEILIVDEVLAVGDAEFQKKCLGKMGDVAGEGRTVLFVSHNMGAIQTLCTSCMLLNNGSIEEIGSTGSVIEKYVEKGDKDVLSWEKKFIKPETEAHFLRVFLADNNYEPISKFTTQNSLRIYIEYEIFQDIKDLHLSIDLIDNYENVIMVTSPVDSNIVLSGSKGVYKFLVSFPSPLLLPREYAIRANLYDSYYKRFDRIDKIKFNVENVFTGNVPLTNRLGNLIIHCDWEEALNE